MKSPYKRPSFFEGVGVALALSLGATCLQRLAQFLGLPAASLSELVIALGMAYAVYLVTRSPRRSGRVTALGAWALVTAVGWLLDPSPTASTLVQISLVALIRVFLYQPRPLAALGDAGLWILGGIAAIWAALSTGSLGLTVWCFFLLQAPFPQLAQLTPIRTRNAGWWQRAKNQPSPPNGPLDGPLDGPLGGPLGGSASERFERAHASAESALRRVASAAPTP